MGDGSEPPQFGERETARHTWRDGSFIVPPPLPLALGDPLSANWDPPTALVFGVDSRCWFPAAAPDYLAAAAGVKLEPTSLAHQGHALAAAAGVKLEPTSLVAHANSILASAGFKVWPTSETDSVVTSFYLLNNYTNSQNPAAFTATNFSIACAANKKYRFFFVLFAGTTTGGLKLEMQAPAGATGEMRFTGPTTGVNTYIGQSKAYTGSPPKATSTQVLCNGGSGVIILDVTTIMSSTAGNVTLNISNVTNGQTITVSASSTLSVFEATSV